MTQSRRPVAVDLFAGCGGLSLGIRRAGFRLAVAVDIDPVATETLIRNHPGTAVIQKDLRQVTGRELLAHCNTEGVALVAGCAPCQGFCSLTAKYRREDPRNGLLLDMARVIEEIRPHAVMMENVPGIATRGRTTFHMFLDRLDQLGYYANHRIVQMADYGVPQSRRRLVVIAGRGFVIPFPHATHARQPRPDSSLLPWLTVRQAIGHMRAPIKLRTARRTGGPQQRNWHVVRDLQPQTRARLRAAIPGKSWLAVDEALRPKCHRGGYVGFTNVYGRMAWDDVSPTLTAGCTTPAKGRFGHPDRRRTTISVREAALLQTFPQDYELATTHMEKACEMIGNAVPPRYAQIVASQIREALEAHRDALAR